MMYVHVIRQHISYKGEYYHRTQNFNNGEIVWYQQVNNQGVRVEGKWAKELEVMYKVNYLNKGIFPDSNFQLTIDYHKEKNHEKMTLKELLRDKLKDRPVIDKSYKEVVE